MTNQDVIIELQHTIDIIKQDGQDWLDERDIPILEVAISALEKQIPKKPNAITIKDNENLWAVYCPSCKSWIGIWNSRLRRGDMYNNSNRNVCPYCGQAIYLEDEL